MSNYSPKSFSSSSVTENKFPPFSELIEEYCDRNPKERTKFICPACGGGNLSVNMKTGRWDCMSEQSADHRQEICRLLNDLYRAEFPEASQGKSGGGKPKTARQQIEAKAKAAEIDAEMGRSAVEMKVEELAHQFDPSSKRGTLAALTVEIAAWAKSGGHDVYGAKMMLKEAIGRSGGNVPTGATGGATGGGNTSNRYPSRDVYDGSGNSKEVDIEELLSSIRELRSLELIGGDRLDPYKLFPDKLASALERAAKALPCPVEALITGLLAVCSRLIGTSSSVKANNTWSEPLVFWGMISGITGSMKSTSLSTVTRPLVRLQAQAERQYERDIQSWKERSAAAKKEGEVAEPEPAKVEFYIDDATFEAVGQAHKENPRGVLVLMDEADAFHNAMNKHRGGKGDDAQRWLPLNGGGQIKVNRLSRKLFVEHTCVPIVGTIQPDTLIPTLRDPKNNISGMNARWNYCNVPFPSPLDSSGDDEAIADLHHELSKLYKALLALPGGTLDEEGNLQQTSYLFSQEGYLLFHKQWMPHIVYAWDREQHQGYKAVLAKQRGFAARNAGLLHLVGQAVNGCESPNRTISLPAVQGGIAIAQFFCNQAKGLYGIAGIESEDQDWTPIVMRLKDASLRSEDGWITPRDAKRKTRLVRSSDHAKSIFAQFVEAGIGELDTSTGYPRWKWSEPKPIAKTSIFEVEVDKLTGDWLPGCAPPVDASSDEANKEESEPVVNKDFQAPKEWVSAPEKKASSSADTHSQTPPQSIEVGDEVIILDTTSPHKGSTGDVVEIITTPSGEILYRVSRDYEGTPELNFEATLSRGNIRVRPKVKYTWDPA